MDIMDNIERPFNRAEAIRDAHAVRLADGVSVRLRAASTSDRDDDAFRRLFFTLSDTTRYLYFSLASPPTRSGPSVSAPSVARMARAPTCWWLRWATNWSGFARFSQGPHADPHERAADLGILLTDAWQGRGLGGHMLCRLAAEALWRGVTTLTAIVLWENRRMLRLARRIFPDMRITYASGTCELTIDLESWWARPDERMCGLSLIGWLCALAAKLPGWKSAGMGMIVRRRLGRNIEQRLQDLVFFAMLQRHQRPAKLAQGEAVGDEPLGVSLRSRIRLAASANAEIRPLPRPASVCQRSMPGANVPKSDTSACQIGVRSSFSGMGRWPASTTAPSGRVHRSADCSVFSEPTVS